VVEGLSHIMDTQLKEMFEEAQIQKIFSENAESLGL
jgi:hypothetical protein